MSTRPSPPSVTPVAPTAPGGRNPWVAVTWGLLLGQAGYLYTRQTKRLVISTLLGTLAIGLAFDWAWHGLPVIDLDQLTQDPLGLNDKLAATADKVLAALAVPSAVATLNNVVCAIDLYWQVIRLREDR